MSRHLTVRLMAEQIERLDMVAEARGMDRSNTIRRLIDEASLTAEERRRLPAEQELLELLAERARRQRRRDQGPAGSASTRTRPRRPRAVGVRRAGRVGRSLPGAQGRFRER